MFCSPPPLTPGGQHSGLQVCHPNVTPPSPSTDNLANQQTVAASRRATPTCTPSPLSPPTLSDILSLSPYLPLRSPLANQVDGSLQTSHPDVYAIGDVATFPLKMYGGALARQEHVANCRETGAHAAKVLAVGKLLWSVALIRVYFDTLQL